MLRRAPNMGFRSPQSAGSPLATKLSAFTRLSTEDREVLAQITSNTIRVDARRDLIEHGDRPQHVHLVLEGWAARYKALPDGKRQIVGLFVPGDFCDLNV